MIGPLGEDEGRVVTPLEPLLLENLLRNDGIAFATLQFVVRWMANLYSGGCPSVFMSIQKMYVLNEPRYISFIKHIFAQRRILAKGSCSRSC